MGEVTSDKVKKILYITMSNLGDALMGLPAFDYLRRKFPNALITVVAGPRTQCVFANHPSVDTLIVFDKYAPIREKIKLFYRLKNEKFDVIVDLKNTFYRFALKAPYKNPAFNRYPSWVKHSNQKHFMKAIWALKEDVKDEEEFRRLALRRNPSFISAGNADYVDGLLKQNGLKPAEEFILIVPGARSELKKWTQLGFIEAIKIIRSHYDYKIIVVGDKGDRALVQGILQGVSDSSVIDLSEKTDFGSLCSLVLRSKLVICHDSGVLHIASYLNRPVLGIYGPSDEVEYGPWSESGMVVRKHILCAPCGKAHCNTGDRECIKTIRPYDILLGMRLMLENQEVSTLAQKYKRILISRTDRMGDVLLSTPVLKSLRDKYPTSFIAMMVSPEARELIEGNPYVDEVILFEKGERHGGLFSAFMFARKLKKYGFDAVVILHPTVRVHLICFLAGIKKRIGYNRKGQFFLTQAFQHRKQEGEKHEAEYNFDLLSFLGVTEISTELYMPVTKNSDDFIDKILKDNGVGLGDALIAVNPAASCVSKHWPLAKFIELIDRLTNLKSIKVVVTADSSHRSITTELIRQTKRAPIDLCGQLTLSQLASLFKRSKLVISNDSGPVHLAVAVKTPVISIFGRNQPGLSPKRWGPLGKLDVALHKEMPCSPCLAHACEKNFQCLEAISVDEVMNHAKRILGQQ